MEHLKRKNCVTVDSLGIDPLLDKVHFNLLDVEDFTFHQISEEEQERPDLLSYRSYGSVLFWWIILSYNRLIKVEDLKKGLILKIPSLSAVSSTTLTKLPNIRTVKF